MNRITTNVDQKLLRTTKFPTEFNQKVDTSKINIPVIKNWAAGEVSRILNYEDDVVIGLLFDLLEGSKFPDIKSLQIQLTGFLANDAATFCKELWNLCLDAQKSDTGIPKQLVEAKKLELIQEKIESERAAEEARRRREDDRERERDLENTRHRERRDRGRGRGGIGGGRDFDRRPPPRDYSRSPPPRNRPRQAPARDTDTYVPGGGNVRRAERRYRSRSRTPPRNSPSRTDQPSPKRRRVSSRSPSYSPERRRDTGRRRGYSPRRRDRSPVRRDRSPVRRYRSRSRSRQPRYDRRRSRTHSISRSERNGRESSYDNTSRPRRRRSPSSSEPTKDVRANVAKDEQSPARNARRQRNTSPGRIPRRSRESEYPDKDRRRSPSSPEIGGSKLDDVSKTENKNTVGVSKVADNGEEASETSKIDVAVGLVNARPTPLNASQLREKLLKQRLINAMQKRA